MARVLTPKTELDDVDHWAQVLNGLESAKPDDLEDLLQSHKINIIKSDGGGSTAINVAVQHSNAAVLDFLLNNWKIDPNLKDAREITALHTAIRVSAPENIFKKIITHPKIELRLRNAVGQTPLEVAVIKGNVEHVQMLLQRGSNPHIHCSDNSHLLHKAVEAGSLSILKLLLQKNVDVNYEQLPELPTPLVLACMKEEESMVKELLSLKDIEPNAKDSQNRPAVVLAFLLGNKDLIDAFLSCRKTDKEALKRFGVILPLETESTDKKYWYQPLPVRRQPRLSHEAIMPIKQDLSDYSWSGKGRDAYFGVSESIRGKWLKSLGQGSYGKVYRYRCEGDGLIVAMKTMTSDSATEKSKESECKILKRIKHPHALELVGTYRDEGKTSTKIGLVLYPAAQYNLDTYLTSGSGFSVTRYCQLSVWLGCISNAVKYLHALDIKHKDLKLQNILVDGNGVYLADFGLSRHFVGGNSQSDGPTKLTKRYCAPEAVDLTNPRGRSADIFSLGCCYVFMANGMIGRSHRDLEDEIGNDAFHEIPNVISVWLDGIAADAITEPYLQGIPDKQAGFLAAIETIRRMLAPQPKLRPSASELYQGFLDCSPWICPTCHPKGSRYLDPLIKYIKPSV